MRVINNEFAILAIPMATKFVELVGNFKSKTFLKSFKLILGDFWILWNLRGKMNLHIVERAPSSHLRKSRKRREKKRIRSNTLCCKYNNSFNEFGCVLLRYRLIFTHPMCGTQNKIQIYGENLLSYFLTVERWENMRSRLFQPLCVRVLR